jgi:hypothetical protein
MSKQLGRITGPLLAENLLRNGFNLSFSNDRTNPATTLLFLDVNNNKIGVNQTAPTRDLSIAGTSNIPTVIATTSANIASLEFSAGKIENFSGNINVTAGDYINISTLQIGDIEINDNYITTTETSADLELRANAAGKIDLDDNVLIDQNLTVLGTTIVQDIDATGTISTASNFNIIGNIDVARDAQFEDIKISQNVISTTATSSNLELSPAGAGTVEVFADTNVTGSLHSTGNITMDGSVTIGDDNTDNITLNAEVASNIVPDQSGVYNLSSELKQWSEVKSVLLNGEDISAAAVAIGGVDIGTPVGNIFYVSVNGSDSNRGDHPQGPFATIKHALSVADSSPEGPTTIYVMTGDYQEELPLVVPANTTVKGLDLRGTIIRPTTSTQSEDVFLMTGETTVEDLTVKDFYYDSLNDKGYAFRFASNAITTTRSPYIRNITVITQGSATSATDPRGFASGDAGKGALVDGTDVNSASADAAMLFHSCTFITPGVDALTMTGGVRVEWLNCFSYFANRGLYAFNDAVGRVNQDGSTINKGAEMRSIGSASVYGNVGAEADGDETLMYLINHNFAYIGTGKNASNDATLVIQENETVELNSGRIYYTSQDAGGNFRVGDAFVVDFDKGTTSLSDSDVALTGISSLTVNTAGDETFINAEKIETGNWRIEDNTISALVGNGNLAAASGTINFTNDVNMQNNLSMTGNFTMSGANFTLGSANNDKVEFDAEITSDIVPNTTNTYNLGRSTNTWATAYLSELTVDNVTISDTTITTPQGNLDLTLLANATGKVLVPENNVEITNDLTVDENSNFNDTTINGLLTHTGNRNQTGNFNVTELNVTGNLNVTRAAQFEDVRIDDNFITTTVTSADLELRATGTNKILIPTNNTVIESNLTVNGIFYADNINVNTSLDINDLVVRNNIQIDDNFITTTDTSSDLELRADDTGMIEIPVNDVEITNNLTVNAETDLLNTTIQGTNTVVGNIDQIGNFGITGTLTVNGNLSLTGGADFPNVQIDDNYITSKTSNSNLELRATSGENVVFENPVDINQDVIVNGTITAQNIEINTDFDLNQLVILNNILIDDNFITTTVTSSDLELRTSGSGNVTLSNLAMSDNIISTTDTLIFKPNNLLTISSSDAIILPAGTIAEKNNQAGSIRFNTDENIFEGYALANVALGTLYSDDYQTRVIAGDIDNTLKFFTNNVENFSISDSANFNSLQVADINIDTNIIQTNTTSADLDLRANGTGNLSVFNLRIDGNNITNATAGKLSLATTGFGSVKVSGTGAVAITSGDTASRRAGAVQGEFRFNTDENIAEVYTGTEWEAAAGTAGDSVSEELMGLIIDEWTLILG